jgi:HlyD family secretion protein
MAGEGDPGISARVVPKAIGAAVVAAVVLLASGGRGRPVDEASAQESRSGGHGDGPAASATARSAAVALARLEPADGLIAVGARPGVRIDRVQVKEGDQVSTGAVLAILEGRESAEQQLALAEAKKKRADQQRDSRKNALAIERAQSDRTSKARLEAAHKAASASEKRFKDGSDLYKKFGASLQGKERYDAEMALYQVELQAIKAALDQRLLETALEAESQKRKLEDRELADHRPDDEILGAQIALARAGLRETEVRAPGAGRILHVVAHPGELSAGTLLEMGDVSSMVATAEVYQSDVSRIRVGDPAELDILGNRVAGKVTRIGSIVGENRLTRVDPRALRDLRVVAVTIELDDGAVAARYVNMEVEVTIRPSGTSPTPQPVNNTTAAGRGPR